MKANNRGKIYSLFALFLLTILFLGNLAINDHVKKTTTASSKSANDEVYKTLLTVELGDVEARDYNRMGSIRAFLEFSPNGDSLIAGTENGEIIAINTGGSAVIWREKIGIGKITALMFSKDGKFLYVGESSPEGNIFCLDAKTGQKIWQRSSTTDLGIKIRAKSLPSIVKIITRENRVYALGLRYERLANGELAYLSKLYALDVQGAEVWQFPSEGCMDAWVSWFNVDENNSRLVFGTANYSQNVLYRYDKNLYGLDAANGKVAWGNDIAPILDAKRTVMRGSPNISADGNTIAAITSDGRGFVYDKAGQLLWQRTISEPKEISNGIYLNAVGRDAYIIDDYVIFATLNTYNSANWQLPAPVEHPSSNNIVVFDRNGNFKSHWQAGGSIEQMDFSYPYAAAAVGRNTKTKDPTIHGLYIYDLVEGKITGRIVTEGPAIAAAVARQGELAAVVEVPLKLDDGRIIGRYKLSFGQKI